MTFKIDSEGYPRHVHECEECKPRAKEQLMRTIAEFLGNLAQAIDDSPYPRGGMAANCRYFKKKLEEAANGRV